MIASSDALKGVHSRYAVVIRTLTYKGFETGDIAMIWGQGGTVIYSPIARTEKYARKEYGLDRDYTGSEMLKKFKDLCADFKISLDENDEVIPQNQTLLCEDNEF